MTNININLTKKFQKLVSYVQKSASTDATRPVLQKVDRFGSDSLIASDGCRLHAVKIAEADHISTLPADTCFDVFRNSSNPGEAIFEPTPDKFPDVTCILPIPNESSVILRINVGFLRDAVSVFDKSDSVAIVLHPYKSSLTSTDGTALNTVTSPVEFFGTVEAKGEDDTDVYALVMPMHSAEFDPKTAWRPGKPKPKQEEKPA